MKKAIPKIVILSLLLCALFVLSGCDTSDMLEYYSNKENYVNASGILDYLDISGDYGMGLGFTDLKLKFIGSTFNIQGENLKVVLGNGLDQALHTGDRVEFVSAPEYFGDGYVMPIVSITVGGVEYLSFDEGYENYLEWLKGRPYSFF